MQEVNSGCGEWSKNSKLAKEERATTPTTSSVTTFQGATSSTMPLRGTVATLACLTAATSLEAQAAMNLDEEAAAVERSSQEPREDVDGIKAEKEENVEELVHKLNRFLHMNLSNPKGESFDAEGIGCGGEWRSTTERKIGGSLFSRYYSRLLQFLQSGSGFGSFFSLIIRIQRGKLHFGVHDKMMREEGRKPFDI